MLGKKLVDALMDDFEFPEEMPEDLRIKVKAKFEIIKKYAYKWHDQIHSLEENELLGLMMALEIEKHNRKVATFAANPGLREAVLRDMGEEPEVIIMGPPMEEKPQRMN